MMASIRKFLSIVLGCICGVCASAPALSSQQPTRTTGVIAFTHASVIPMDAERVLRDHTVVVANGRITAVGPTGAVQVPEDALRIDATGRYLLPAYCDMHVHPLGEPWNAMLPPEAQLATAAVPFERFLFPFVAQGRHDGSGALGDTRPHSPARPDHPG